MRVIVRPSRASVSRREDVLTMMTFLDELMMLDRTCKLIRDSRDVVSWWLVYRGGWYVIQSLLSGGNNCWVDMEM